MKQYGEVIENADLRNYSTLGVGGIVKYLVKPNTENDLCNLIKELRKENIKYIILGNGSNVIIDDTYFDGVVIRLDNLKEITFEDNEVTASCGVMLPMLVNVCLQKSYVSLAFASMIPGTVGGSVVGNAGAYGHEIMEYVKSVKVLDKEGNIITLQRDNISYGYRYTSLKDKYIILSATFILENGDPIKELEEIRERNEKRIATQPIEKKNVGSIFRNPEGTSSGKLIDELGLKGYQVGGAKISEKHANFIVNENNATFEDVINLINLIKDRVKENYDINLVAEPTIIRWEEV
ncbi:MAG: UDP-N-acetylmuramate dehydrogenase [Firmicutes bacterium]|nr:UDP-N-acetylmuramate dehydrogenase [Bacillota bacterium]